MTSREIIFESKKYIEENLLEPLTPEFLASRAGFSTYHYCKLFSLYNGVPVMEYIRRRRLAYAASDICENKRILDVAFDYGFESHNGFSKAFKKIYNFSPEEFRKRTKNHRPPSPNPLRDLSEKNFNTSPVCRIENVHEFYIAGIELSVSENLSSIAQQPPLWQIFELREIEHKLYALASPKEHGEYYVSLPMDDGRYKLISGVKVENPNGLDEQLCIEKIKTNLYAIFTTPPCMGSTMAFSEKITDTWKYIFEVWLPSSDYSIDSDGLDFEFYDERCHGEPYSMDIYLPVKKDEK